MFLGHRIIKLNCSSKLKLKKYRISVILDSVGGGVVSVFLVNLRFVIKAKKQPKLFLQLSPTVGTN